MTKKEFINLISNGKEDVIGNCLKLFNTFYYFLSTGDLAAGIPYNIPSVLRSSSISGQ